MVRSGRPDSAGGQQSLGELVSGAVKDVEVHAANPPDVLDQAAVGALLQWRYKPALRDAKPAEQRVRMRIRFSVPR